jgi:hypothetical protein
MMTKYQIQTKIAQWEQALKDQEAIIQEHQQKADYCKTVLEGLKYDLEHEHFA